MPSRLVSGITAIANLLFGHEMVAIFGVLLLAWNIIISASLRASFLSASAGGGLSR